MHNWGNEKQLGDWVNIKFIQYIDTDDIRPFSMYSWTDSINFKI